MGPGLVEATLADVADPLHDVMVAVVQLGLKHLEEEEWWAGFGRETPYNYTIYTGEVAGGLFSSRPVLPAHVIFTSVTSSATQRARQTADTLTDHRTEQRKV